MMTMRSLIALCRIVAAALILAAAIPMAAQAKSPEIYTGLVRGTAVGGYDPVAYFKDGKPVRGKADITFQWKGATWRFADAANRDAFKADPEKYAPQYGGYCAYAVAQGATAKGDPQVWKIVSGKLYLNVNASVQKRWEQDIPGFIAKADKSWPGVLK
jgi:YHS domain-containing protein